MDGRGGPSAVAASAIWRPRLPRSRLLRPCFVPRSPPHSSGLRSFQVSAREGARARHPGTLSQPPWRARTSTTSGWTPLPTCGAERRREGGDGPGQVRSRQHLTFYPSVPSLPIALLHCPGGRAPRPPKDTLGPGEGAGGGRYGYCETTRRFTKAWPAVYDDLWNGFPVPHCRRHRRRRRRRRRPLSRGYEC